MIKTKTSLTQVAVLFAGAMISMAAADRSKPNIILIMADDLGYRDLSCYGHPAIRTPVLDRFAKEGIKLTSFYSGATVCTPSRMALLTGAYPTRLGWTKGVIGYKMSKKEGLNPKALTIAEIFKDNGYQTGLIGKWHIGDLPPFLPHRQGFDSTYYINKSNNQTTKIWQGDKLVEDPYKKGMLSEKFTREAISFIKRNKTKPFFLYIPYTAPHFSRKHDGPIDAHPDWQGKSNYGSYGDVVEELDFRIGEVLKTLKEEGLDEKTIVVFTSDNGPQPGQKAQAKPFRGIKWDSLEGGTRVPCIIRWPDVIPAGQESDALIAAIDILPTLARACGIDLKGISKDSPVIDGMNVWDTLIGKTDVPHPRKDLLYWHGLGGLDAIRVGNFKLFLNSRNAKLKNRKNGPVLFNLAEESNEKTDLSSKYPKKVQEMQQLARKRLANINKNILPLGALKIDWSKVKTGGVYASKSAPAVVKKAFKISGEMEVAAEAKQVVLAHGGTAVGYSLYLNGGEPVFAVSTGKNHLERISTSALAGKFSFEAGMGDKGHLFVQVGDNEAVSSQRGGHWISKWPGEDLSVGFDYGHPVAPKSPKEKFKGKLLKLNVK